MANSKALDRTFRISLILKALDATLEIAGGITLLFVSPHTINNFVRWLIFHEMAQNPHDFVARHLLHAASQLSRSKTLYGALYLLIHGVAKLALVALVLLEKLWAYPWLVGLLLAFVVYQSYRMTVHFSIGLLLLTLFDLFVAWLTWREYQAKRSRAPSEAVPATS